MFIKNAIRYIIYFYFVKIIVEKLSILTLRKISVYKER